MEEERKGERECAGGGAVVTQHTLHTLVAVLAPDLAHRREAGQTQSCRMCTTPDALPFISDCWHATRHGLIFNEAKKRFPMT